MNVLAINGSPRIGGNTEALLRKVLESLKAAGWSTELRQLGGKPVRGCLACFKCIERKNMRCVIESDGVNELLQAMTKADAILLDSPTFFAGLTPELKALIDRAGFVALANGGALRGKIGAAVVAVRRGGAIHVFDSINHLFQISGMITPGSLYWNIGVGQHKEQVLEDAEAMRNMEHLGQTIAWLGKGLKAAAEMEPFPWPEGAGVEAC